MDVTTQGTDYAALFREYIVNGAQLTLAQVRQSTELIWQVAERTTVLQMLDFMLEYPTTTSEALEILEKLAPPMEQAGYWESWIPYMQRGLRQAQVSQNQSATAKLQLLLGILCQQQGDLQAARAYLTQSVDQFEILGEPLDQAKALNRLAYVARLQRCYPESRELADRALDLPALDDDERSFSYFVHGVIAFDHEAWAVAVDYLQRSVALLEAHGDKRILARRLRNLGPALRALGRYDEAVACYERAIGLFAQEKDPVQQAVTHMNYGVTLWQIGQLEQALVQFALAEPALRTAQDRMHLAMLYANQGLVYRDLQQWDAAKRHCEASVDLWQVLGNLRLLADSLMELGVVYLKQGYKEQAISTFQSALTHLAQIENAPGYATLYATVTQYLQEAQALADDAALVGLLTHQRPLAMPTS